MKESLDMLVEPALPHPQIRHTEERASQMEKTVVPTAKMLYRVATMVVISYTLVSTVAIISRTIIAVAESQTRQYNHIVDTIGKVGNANALLR